MEWRIITVDKVGKYMEKLILTEKISAETPFFSKQFKEIVFEDGMFRYEIAYEKGKQYVDYILFLNSTTQLYTTISILGDISFIPGYFHTFYGSYFYIGFYVKEFTCVNFVCINEEPTNYYSPTGFYLKTVVEDTLGNVLESKRVKLNYKKDDKGYHIFIPKFAYETKENGSISYKLFAKTERKDFLVFDYNVPNYDKAFIPYGSCRPPICFL